MSIKTAIYGALQEYCGDPAEVNLEDLIAVGCSYRHYLRLEGTVPTRPERGRDILLRETGLDARRLISRYLRGCFKKRYRDGYYRVEGEVTVRIDGFLGDRLVDIALVPTLRFDPKVPPRSAVIAAATKAHVVGAERVLLITVDRDKQAWAFFDLSGDFEDTATPVRRDMHYINSLRSGSAVHLGTASPATCRVCPVVGKCDVNTSEDPPPARVRGVRVTPEVDTQILVDSYLWGLNGKPNNRATRCIHPSEISTTSCDAVIAHGLIGTEEKPSIDPMLRRIFDFGHCFHDVVQAALSWGLDDFEAEAPARHGGLRIRGHCDGVYGNTAAEIKSIGSKSFAKLTSAKSAHKKQATIYGVLLGTEDIQYIYVCKETGEIADFATPVDRSLWHRIATRAESIRDQVDAGEMPEGTGSDYQCSRCKYAWKCKPQALRNFADGDTRKLRRFGR